MDPITKQCPYCAETIQAAAVVCRFCNRDLPNPNTSVLIDVLKEKRKSGEISEAEFNQLFQNIVEKNQSKTTEDASKDYLGLPLLLIPILGMGLMYFAWMKISGSFSLIQARTVIDGAKESFYMAMGLVLFGSAILVGIDAGRYGFGKNKNHAKYALRTGPIGWAIGQVLLWVIAYPWYMLSRNSASSKAYNLGPFSIILTFCFVTTGYFVNSEMDKRIEDVNYRLEEIRSTFSGTTSSRRRTRNVEPPVVTLQDYNSLQNGMSYDQVKNIIGNSGRELSRSDLAGYSTVMYSWSNSGGSNMNAMFQNGKMINKAQFGLR